jgi:hypothetical protein
MSAANSRVHYDVFPIEGTVNDRGLILWVKDSFFKASTSLVENTTLENFMATEDVPKGDAITNGYGSYLYREQLPKSGDSMRFLFLAPKTEDQQLEQVKEPSRIWRVVDWPDVLLSLYGVKGKVLTSEVGSNSGGATSNTATTERYFDRYKLIKGGNYNTEVLVEKFFSPTYIPSMYATEPRPMPVYYNFLGMTQSILALHPEIEVPELTVELELVRGFGTKPIIQNWKLPSVFPKTNMLTWVTHPRFLEVTERDGGFYYTRGTVTPPEIPKTIEI